MRKRGSIRTRIRGAVRVAAALAGIIAWSAGAMAQFTLEDGVEVDLELVLAVDVSRSMTERELEIQRRGYAEALTSDEVIAAITTGMLGRIALTYVEWAGTQRVVIDWRLIENRADALAFAEQLTIDFNPALRRTSISGAIDYASTLFAGNGYAGMRRVIDISGDGPNNEGRPVVPARDEAVAKGLVINGLPLMTREGMGSQWHLEDLDLYYTDCVIGGTGAFVVPVHEWETFPEAVKRKLILEIAGGRHLHDYAALDQVEEGAVHRANERPEYDCMIGEKIWQRFRYNYMEP